MTFDDFVSFLSASGGFSRLPPPQMRKVWAKIIASIEPHFLGEIPPALEVAFPNEGDEIMQYRRGIYNAKTEAVVTQAINDVCRLLTTSKFSVSYELEAMKKFVDESLFNGLDFYSYIFEIAYSRRVVDPNAFLLSTVSGDGVTNDAVAVDVGLQIISSRRVHFVSPNGDLLIYKPMQAEKGLLAKVVTDQFFGEIVVDDKGEIKAREVYVHNLGRAPFVKLGGRSVVRIDKAGVEHTVYKSDFSPAVPYLNDVAISDNQHTSVLLSSCFPFKFVKGVTCKDCNGDGYVLPREIDPENPDARHTCKTCDGNGQTLFSSPLAGYYLQPPAEGATDDERRLHALSKPLEFISPPVDTIRYTGENATKALEKAEEILNIRLSLRRSISGKAKEIDKESQFVQVGKISDYIFGTLISQTLEILQGLRFLDTESAIVVNPPQSFNLETDLTLLNTFIESLKGLPINLRFASYKDFIKRRYHADALGHRIAELLVAYADLYLYTTDERDALLAQRVATKDDVVRAVFAFNELLQLSKTINLNDTKNEVIFAKLDAALADRFTPAPIDEPPVPLDEL